MHREDLVVCTKRTLPRPHKHALHRPRMTRWLLEVLDYRLAVVRTRTAYGKSRVLAALADREYPPTWCHLGAQDADSFVLLLHLLHAFWIAWPDTTERALAALAGWKGATSLAAHGSSLLYHHLLLDLLSHRLEAVQFECLVQEGDQLFHGHPEAPIDRYGQALSCYRRSTSTGMSSLGLSQPGESARFLTLFLRTAGHMSGVLAEREEWDETIETNRSAPACDTCWQAAFRLMMPVYAKRGR